MTTESASRERANEKMMGAASIVAGTLIGAGLVIHPVWTSDAAGQIAIVSADPGRWFLTHGLLIAGLGCFIPALLLMMRRLAATNPRWARVAGVSAFVGLVSAVAFVTVDGIVLWSLGKPGLDPGTTHLVFDELTKGAQPSIVFLPSILLNLGVLALAIGLFRSAAIPRWAAASLAAGMIVQAVFGLAYVQAGAAGAGVLLGVGFIGVGLDGLRSGRRPSDEVGTARAPLDPQVAHAGGMF